MRYALRLLFMLGVLGFAGCDLSTEIDDPLAGQQDGEGAPGDDASDSGVPSDDVASADGAPPPPPPPPPPTLPGPADSSDTTADVTDGDEPSGDGTGASDTSDADGDVDSDGDSDSGNGEISDGEPTDPASPLAEVAHEREMRGIWIATAWAINFPGGVGRSAAQLRQELTALVDVTEEAGLNAIFFQVRPEGDAFFDSQHDPWSRWLTGTQGGDPGIDPLAVLIELAHPRGIEVHAWLNPYRARVSSASGLHSSHMASTWPQYAYPYGNGTWMDPAAEPVQQRLLDVIGELVENYALDGIHFDDYFYPYPVAGSPFPDDATWSAYQSSGGPLTDRADWRRENVNTMVRRVHERVQELDSSVRFGISPFGIYRPGQPAGITGLDAYASLYADPVRWMEEGWVDYVAPQLYWPTTQTAQAYEPLLDWWTGVRPDQTVFAGNYLSQLGETSSWTIAEFREQLRLSRSMRDRLSTGNIWYQIGPLMTDREGIRGVFRDEFYPEPALTPVLAAAREREATPPDVNLAGDVATIAHSDPRPVRGITVYRRNGDGWVLADIHGPEVESLSFGPGDWAIATVTRDGVESPGVIITVD